MSAGQPRPTFDAGLAAVLRRQLEDEVAPAVADLGPEPLAVNKRCLGQVHTCESHYQSELGQPFPATVPTLVGTIVHRAVELSVAGPPRFPLELVRQAMASLTAEDPRNTVRPFLLGAPAEQLAELQACANEAVVKFKECWPPLKAAWVPRAEMRIRADLCEDRVRLHGKVDLALGLPRGQEARELFVDLKTGRSYPSHLDDLRFYALVQTLRAGVPPFRVVSYYFESATFHYEDVTVETLEIALRRTVDGVHKMAELRQGGRPPTISPGPTCSYCRLNATCVGARQWEGAP